MLSQVSCIRLSATPWTTACQAPLSMGFSRQKYWSGLPFPSPEIKCEVSEVKLLSHVQLFATPWILAYQAPLSMGFSRQEYWSGLPFPSLLEWVAYPFSRGSSLPRNQTGVSCIAGGFFTSSAIREAIFIYSYLSIWASQVALVVKNPPANAGDIRDVSLIPGSGRFPGGGHGNLLQYSCLENPVG